MNYAFCIYFELIFVVLTCHKVFGDVGKEKNTILQNEYGEVILTEDGPPPPVCRSPAWAAPVQPATGIRVRLTHLL